MESIRMGIMIIPPFITMSIIDIICGAGCDGSAGAAEIALFSVSKADVLYKRVAVILI
jgi:hypothetical protein